jgi:hypothetical protein
MKKLFSVIIAMIMAGLLMSSNVYGQERKSELFMLGGINGTDKERTYIFESGIWLPLGSDFGGQLSYVNEGHIDGSRYSHRDGLSVLTTHDFPFFDGRLVVRPKVGPYFFCDTQDNGTQIETNIGGRVGVATNLYLSSKKNFFITTEVGYIWAINSRDSYFFLAGAGFVLGVSSSKDGADGEKLNEISLGFGKALPNIKNGFDKDGTAFELEFRRKVFKYVEFTSSFISEGDYRKGVAVIPEAVIKIQNTPISLGLGAGPYFSYEEHNFRANGVVAITAAYEFYDNLVLRGTFKRVVASYQDGSSDIFTASFGYRF